jgi:hypothetical protein
MADKEGDRPSGQLIRQNNHYQQEPELSPQGRQEGSVPAPSMDPEILRKLSHTPKGEDPAYWPVRVFNELDYYIAVKDDPTVGSVTRAIGEKYAPFQESIRKVKTAYAILSHSHCQESASWRVRGWQYEIEAGLERDRQTYGRDQVTLTDPEFQILNQITTARKITLDPEKRVYSYSEVPIAPWIDPYGRRRMTTQEIRDQLNPEAKKQTVFPPTDKQRPNLAGKPGA